MVFINHVHYTSKSVHKAMRLCWIKTSKLVT